MSIPSNFRLYSNYLRCAYIEWPTFLPDGAAGTTDGAAGAVEEARRRFLPVMRPDASTPEGVYAARDIAGEQELQAMGRHVDRSAEEYEVRRSGVRIAHVSAFNVQNAARDTNRESFQSHCEN